MRAYLIYISYQIINIYSYLILISVIMSWMRVSPYSNFFTRVVYDLTNPLYRLIQKYIPSVKQGVLDFTPMVAYMLLILLRMLIINI